MDSPVQTKQHKKDASQDRLSPQARGKMKENCRGRKKKNFNMQHSSTGLETDVWVLT